MGMTVYGRKAIRRVERATGEKIVHMAGPWFTTLDHRHFIRRSTPQAPRWELIPPGGEAGCGLGVHLWSCGILFGHGKENGDVGKRFMRGPCVGGCGAERDMLHAWDCPHLQYILEMDSINPDYWPRPVHRPQWMDDPRRDRVGLRTQAMYRLALGLDVPIELLGGPSLNHWSSFTAHKPRMGIWGAQQWHTFNARGTCWRCQAPTTHVVEWPPGAIENIYQGRTFACHACALHIRQYQDSMHHPGFVTVREQWESH